MQTVRLGERFDGLKRSILKRLDPSLSTDDRSDQAFVMPALLRILVVQRGCRISGFLRPCNFYLRAGPARRRAIGARDRYQQPVAANNDALKHSNEVRPIVGFGPPLMRFKGSKNGASLSLRLGRVRPTLL